MSVALAAKAAAVLLWIIALGFGYPCLLSIKNLLTEGTIPYFMGFPAYGGGPFERHGILTTIPLVAGFLLINILEGVAGGQLWGGYKSGAILAILLLPVGAVYWWGFALPIPPIFAIARTILIILCWSGLK